MPAKDVRARPVTAPGRPGGWQGFPRREGAFWVLVALGVPRLCGAVLTIALRRYLGPGISGTFDLAYAPYRFLDNFRSFGTGPALIYEKTVSRATANTAWTLNVLAAVIVTVIAQLLAGPIAHYYGHPRIEGVFRLLSIAYVFAAISSAHAFLLLRDRDFRARSIPPIGQVIVAGGIAVLFAVWGFRIGALVIRELASVIVGSILLWAVYPFRPRFQVVPRLAARLFSYGAWIGAGITVMYLSQNVDIFIGGRIIHRTSDIGFYTTTWTVAFLAAGIMSVAVSSLVFPALSRLQDRRATRTDTLLRALRQMSLVMLPVAALLAAAAPVVIVPLLGGRFGAYRSSFPVLSLLAVYAGNRTVLAIFYEGYKAVGRPWLVPAFNLGKLLIMAPATIVGAQHGILGLALAYVPLQVIEIPAALLLAHRVLDISPGQVWRATRLPLLTALFMAGAVIAAEVVMRSRVHAGDTVTLAMCLVVGVLTYLGPVSVLDRRIIWEAKELLLHGL